MKQISLATTGYELITKRTRKRIFEKLKAGIRAKVEHPFRVLKCQFGYRKTR